MNHLLDIAIVALFVAYSVGVGLHARGRASRSLEEYFLAGRGVRGWQAGASMAATQLAADTPLLVTGLIASAGIFMLWRLWIYGLAFLFMAFVLAALWRRARVLTDAELAEIRYSGRGVLTLRVIKAFYYGTLINSVVLAIVMVATVRIAEVFLPWHAWLPEAFYEPLRAAVEWSGLAIAQSITGLDAPTANTDAVISIVSILAFIGLYSTAGGLRGVIATDVAQLSIALLGTAAYAVFIVLAIGEGESLGERVADLYGDTGPAMLSFWPTSAPSVGDVAAGFGLIIALQWLFQMNSDGTGYLAQRSIACRSDGDARIAGVVFAWVQILLRSLLWLVIGLGLLVVYPFDPASADDAGFIAARELTFVTGVDELLPPGLRGLMLTGMLAALASTVDTHLNWGASYWTNDLYGRLLCREWQRREPSGRELVLVARIANVVVVALSLVVMANLGSIQQAWLLSLLFGAGTGSVLVLRWLWERVNLHAELAAMAVSLAVAPVLLVVTDAEWLRLGAMALVSTTAVIVVTLITPPTDAAVLEAFYRRVRPVGWWSRTARAAGDAPRTPLRALAATALDAAVCAVSLYALLIGFGTIIVHGLAPGPLGWLSLALGLALVPVWWRALRRGAEPRPD
ncbi:MAG: sodium:solute symporter family protein [Gammaproteobacteria bacterium]|nr:sodium:solute symporter family protein [Gammaproteobacteria bacterium]